MFALVPEDAYLPPDVMVAMFSVLSAGKACQQVGGKRIGPLHLRKYTQTLISRSLIIGTVERPRKSAGGMLLRPLLQL
jgi:hypothetical protein